MDKPKDIKEYEKWLWEQHKIETSERTETYYNSVMTKVKLDLEKSEFWSQLIKNLKEYDAEYYLKSDGYNLLPPDFKPQLYIKPFDSFLEKTYRKNVVENNNWPEQPEKGWVLPSNWYSQINDIIRTSIVVKYLDGVDFIANKTRLLCEQDKLYYNVDLEAREEGYYAAHQSIKKEFEIPQINWDTKKINFTIEIKIITELQENIQKLLHKYYEGRRKSISKENIKWQWNYKSDEFITNYLGHILHYVEGMIMEIRDKQKERGKI